MFLFRPATSRHLWAPLARCTSYQSSTLLPAVFRHPLGLLLAGRPISILSSYRSLHKLETDANKLPQDAAKQVVLYQVRYSYISRCIVLRCYISAPLWPTGVDCFPLFIVCCYRLLIRLTNRAK